MIAGPERGLGLALLDGGGAAMLPARCVNEYDAVPFDPTRADCDADRLAIEVIAHFAALMYANIRVTLEVEVNIPADAGSIDDA